MKKTYIEFLKGKVIDTDGSGIAISDHEMFPHLKPHQIDTVKWALKQGKALIASSFGLGKTRIQLEIARLVVNKTKKNFLVVCPLGVKYQFQEEDGPIMGQRWIYVKNMKDVRNADTPYLITNYERVRDGNLNIPEMNLGGVSLDEGSVLRSLGSKTQQLFNLVFSGVPYRFVATATPSPNDYTELLNYADFFGIMPRGNALTRWFKRDSSKAGNLKLNQSNAKEFWLWVASWALFIYKPSDLGYDDSGYELPEMKVHWHRINVDHSRAFDQIDNRGQRRLLLNAAGGVSQAAQERKATLQERMEKSMEIMAEHPERHYLLWHYLEYERHAIEKNIPDATTVYGSQKLDVKEERLAGFAHGEIKILATKPEIAGMGNNFQKYCNDAIFMGVDYRFQDFIQAVHRIYRFQQTKVVNIHIIYAESQDAVVNTLKRKWREHDHLVEQMRKIIHKYGLVNEAIRRDLNMTIGVNREEHTGKLFTAVYNDCVFEMERFDNNSVDLIHTSIPFGNHYSYVPQEGAYDDFGHNGSDAEFWQQMEYLIPELYRILKPGRVAAIHVKDRVLYGHQTQSNFMEISPFSDECVFEFRRHGWMYEGRRTIVTDVVRENNSTYRLGWTEMTKDASKMGSGLPEYLLLFRKPPSDNSTARADEPVTKSKEDYTRARWQIDAHAFWRDNGNRLLLPDELYDYHAHVKRLEDKEDKGHLPASFFLEPPTAPLPWEDSHVWDDIIFMRSLNSNQARGRQENHICPLPFDIVERAIVLYSNPGELVLDPFAGLFTVPYMAVKLDRIGYGIELNYEYYNVGVKYCKEIEQTKLAPTLFDWLELQSEVDPEKELA